MGYLVSVVGGGQLARMMAQPASALHINLRALVEAADGSAAQVIADSPVGLPADLTAMRSLARGADALTFEHEHIPAETLETLANEGVNIQPSAQALAAAQDKIHMRRVLSEAGVPCPRWASASTAEEVRDFGDEAGWPIIVKVPTGGYDGKGVVVLDREDREGWDAVAQWLNSPRGEVLAEEKVNFVRELAALSARRPSGQFVAWPVVQTVQENGVCAEVVCPAPLADEAKTTALRIAHQVASTLAVTGVLAVELFETDTGELLVNELAMRPHNSGHVTIEASRTSQFEQHLRAVLDLPLGATEPTCGHAVMVNLLGSALEDPRAAYPEVLRRYPEAKVHLYGKSVRPGRKLGHVTITGHDPERTLARARAAVALLRGEDGAADDDETSPAAKPGQNAPTGQKEIA